MTLHSSNAALAEVFSADELAIATSATPAEVDAWIEAGLIRALPVGDGLVLGLHALKRCVPAAQLPPAQSPRR